MFPVTPTASTSSAPNHDQKRNYTIHMKTPKYIILTLALGICSADAITSTYNSFNFSGHIEAQPEGFSGYSHAEPDSFFQIGQHFTGNLTWSAAFTNSLGDGKYLQPGNLTISICEFEFRPILDHLIYSERSIGPDDNAQFSVRFPESNSSIFGPSIDSMLISFSDPTGLFWNTHDAGDLNKLEQFFTNNFVYVASGADMLRNGKLIKPSFFGKIDCLTPVARAGLPIPDAGSTAILLGMALSLLGLAKNRMNRRKEEEEGE